jgi:hypothetical protein
MSLEHDKVKGFLQLKTGTFYKKEVLEREFYDSFEMLGLISEL